MSTSPSAAGFGQLGEWTLHRARCLAGDPDSRHALVELQASTRELLPAIARVRAP
jgi:hypothetical protein